MTDDELRELQERAYQLAELTRSPFWPLFVQTAEEELAKHRRAVLAGQLDPQQYQRATGYLAGGEMVVQIPALVHQIYVDELARRADEEVEHERERTESDTHTGIPD